MTTTQKLLLAGAAIAAGVYFYNKKSLSNLNTAIDEAIADPSRISVQLPLPGAGTEEVNPLIQAVSSNPNPPARPSSAIVKNNAATNAVRPSATTGTGTSIKFAQASQNATQSTVVKQDKLSASNTGVTKGSVRAGATRI